MTPPEAWKTRTYSTDKVDSSWAESRRGLMLSPCVHSVVFTTRATVNDPSSLPLWKNLPGPSCLLQKNGLLTDRGCTDLLQRPLL